MNIYLSQICAISSMDKQASTDNPKTELMQTATIGAAGMGTGMLASKIGKSIPSIAEHAGKMGALIGGMGLLGDYAAVKINKAIEKKATDNKYLEKVAEMYTVRGHDGYGHGILKTPNISLNRPEYHHYAKHVDDHPVQALPLATMALGAGIGGFIGHKRGDLKGLSTLIGAGLGAVIGRPIAERYAHNSALEEMRMVHPYHQLLNTDED